MGQQGRRGPKLIPHGKLITTKLPLVVDDAALWWSGCAPMASCRRLPCR